MWVLPPRRLVLIGFAAVSFGFAVPLSWWPAQPVMAEPVDPVPNDPLAGEGAADDQPDDDIEVPPPPGGYRSQGRFEPRGVLWSSVAAAERKLQTARETELASVARVQAARLRLKRLDDRRVEIDLASQTTTRDLLEATDRFTRRAVHGFRFFVYDNEVSDAETGFVDKDPMAEANAVLRRDRLIASALDVDEADTERLDTLRQRLDQDQLAALTRRELLVEQLAEAAGSAREAQRATRQAEAEYRAFQAGSQIFIDDVVFPIGGPSDPFIDSFGFPRMAGTPDEHWHEGIDLFAPRGTPLVAAERGVIARLGSGRLGGLKFWLVGESGSEWYYAHLDAFAPGIADGVVVEAGDLVGYVGNTGNAIGTPPHLHLQLHPNGGRPVNPYPLLRVVADQETELRAAGDPLVAWVHDPIGP